MISLRKTAQKLTIHFDLLTKRYEITNMLIGREIKRRHAEMTSPSISVVTEQSSSQGVNAPDLRIAKRTGLLPQKLVLFLPSSAKKIVTEGSVSHRF